MAHEPVLYPRLYPWYVLLASLDVLLTWIILSPRLGGIEINPIAAQVIQAGGMTGATFFKFATVMFVMWACEFVGRRQADSGRRILWVAVCANCAVVFISLGQLAAAGFLGWL